MDAAFWEMNVMKMLVNMHVANAITRQNVRVEPIPIVDGQPLERFEWQVHDRRYMLHAKEYRWQLDDGSERYALAAWLDEETTLFYYVPQEAADGR